MPPRNPIYRLATLAAAFFVIPAIAPSQQPTKSKIAQAGTPDAYPNTVEGLRHLLSGLLLTAKNGDQDKLRSLIMEMEIPNYETWFTQIFGPEKGKSWAGPYGKSLQATEVQFQMLWTELAKQQGEFLIEKVDTTKRYDAPTSPLDEYKANWKKMDDSMGPDRQSIGLLYFVDGKFRLNGAFHEARVLSPNKGGALEPAMLINRIQPVYPKEAQEKRIQGTVALNVVQRKDGTVTLLNVAGGDPILATAAVEAVQQWRYRPTLVGGEPVDVQTKIYVTFQLPSPPQPPDPKEMPESKGSIAGGNTYHNPALSMTMTLPGAWHFFDRTMYSTPEVRQKEKETAERVRATCQGPLCGDAEIDVALQSPEIPPLVHAIYVTAYHLSSEYQNRQRHPLKVFAKVMTIGSLGDNWIPEGDLTAIELDGRPAYRLIVHDKRTPTAKGFLYVADANGRIFMLLGTAVSEPKELQSAIENMKLTN